MKWIWVMSLVALSGVIAACSNDTTAGSTFETENSIAKILLKNADGTPAAKKSVAIRDENALISIEKNSNSYSVWDSISSVYETDENGIAWVRQIASGNYIVEALEYSNQNVFVAVSRFSIPKTPLDSSVSVTLFLDLATTLSGEIQSDKSPIVLQIRGTSFWTVADSLGHFTFDVVPQGKFDIVMLCQGEILSEQEVEIQEENEKVFFKDSTMKEIPMDTIPQDTTVIDTIPQDTTPEVKAYVLDDFEDSTLLWYRSTSKYATAKLERDSAGLGRKGFVAHFSSTNDSVGNWALMGRYIGETDMSHVDSVTFWARGEVNGKISFAFDVLADSTATYDSGKSWQHFELDSVWTHYTVTPEILLPADSIGGNIGWDAVKTHVTNISFFGGAGGEFWLDDVVFYTSEKVEK